MSTLSTTNGPINSRHGPAGGAARLFGATLGLTLTLAAGLPATAAPAGGIGVTVPDQWITAADLSGRDDPVAVDLNITSGTPIQAWSVEVVQSGPDATVSKLDQQSHPEIKVEPGSNRIVLGTTKQIGLVDRLGPHEVRVSVKNQAGESAETTAQIKVKGRATLSVEGVSGSAKAKKPSLVWGEGSEELRGRHVQVLFRAKGQDKFTKLGTVSVRKSNGYWVLRSSKLTAGTIRVVADSPYVGGTRAVRAFGAKAFAKSHPDFLEDRPLL